MCSINLQANSMIMESQKTHGDLDAPLEKCGSAKFLLETHSLADMLYF